MSSTPPAPRRGRPSRMDLVAKGLSNSEYNGEPRARSCGRTTRSQRSKSTRAPQRSNSATRLRIERERSEAEDAQRRAQADEAFLEWLKRKMKMPRQPKASPSREQIEAYSRDDAKQKVLNIWHSKYPRSLSRGNGFGNGDNRNTTMSPENRR